MYVCDGKHINTRTITHIFIENVSGEKMKKIFSCVLFFLFQFHPDSPNNGGPDTPC